MSCSTGRLSAGNGYSPPQPALPTDDDFFRCPSCHLRILKGMALKHGARHRLGFREERLFFLAQANRSPFVDLSEPEEWRPAAVMARLSLFSQEQAQALLDGRN